MNPESQEQLKAYGTKASEQDIPKIAKDLDGMNRGGIKNIWAEVQLLWTMVKDPQAAWSSKAIAIGALVYLVSPIDVIFHPPETFRRVLLNTHPVGIGASQLGHSPRVPRQGGSLIPREGFRRLGVDEGRATLFAEIRQNKHGV